VIVEVISAPSLSVVVTVEVCELIIDSVVCETSEPNESVAEDAELPTDSAAELAELVAEEIPLPMDSVSDEAPEPSVTDSRAEDPSEAIDVATEPGALVTVSMTSPTPEVMLSITPWEATAVARARKRVFLNCMIEVLYVCLF
jgi:hypothetical protein